MNDEERKTILVVEDDPDVLSAIVKNLANNASEALLQKDDLTLSLLAKEAIQDPMTKDDSKDIISSIIAIISTIATISKRCLVDNKENHLYMFTTPYNPFISLVLGITIDYSTAL